MGIKTFTEKENKLIISFLISFSVTGPLACSCLVLWDVLSCLYFSAFWFPWGVRHHFGTLVRLSWPQWLKIIGVILFFLQEESGSFTGWLLFFYLSVVCTLFQVLLELQLTVCFWLCSVPINPTILQILVLEFSILSHFSLKTVLPADSLS